MSIQSRPLIHAHMVHTTDHTQLRLPVLRASWGPPRGGGARGSGRAVCGHENAVTDAPAWRGERNQPAAVLGLDERERQRGEVSLAILPPCNSHGDRQTFPWNVVTIAVVRVRRRSLPLPGRGPMSAADGSARAGASVPAASAQPLALRSAIWTSKVARSGPKRRSSPQERWIRSVVGSGGGRPAAVDSARARSLALR